MREPVRSTFLAVIVLTSSACDVEDASREATEDVGFGSAALELPPTAVEACLDSRRVGITTTGSCPAAGSTAQGTWKATAAFPGATEPHLKSHCVYDWSAFQVGAPPDPALLPTMNGQPPSTWLGQDCFVAAPLAGLDETRQTVRGELAAAHRASLGVPAVFPGGPRSSVRVAVVDTSPTSPLPSLHPVRGANDHGYDVARVVEDVACGAANPGCAVRAPTVLGLPLTAPNTRDTVRGGSFGTQLDVAQGVWRAVSQWRNESAQTRPKHLVLNLSLGWQGELGGPLPSGAPVGTLRGAVRTAYDALVYASCADALVVVAAGNDGGGPVRGTGAMYPAGWENRAAPTENACVASFGPKLKPIQGGVYAPLVHAVGAVTPGDERAANTRVAGRPRLVAPGVSVSAEVGAGTTVLLPGGVTTVTAAPAHTIARTGSSMAAASASATAALVWSIRPDLAKHAVMDLVYGTAMALPGEVADFCQGASCPGIARVSTCQALRTACATPGACTSVPVCATPPARSGDVFTMSNASRDSLAWLFTGAPAVTFAIDLDDTHGAPACGDTIALGDEAGVEPCVDRTYFGEPSVPFALPQPSGNGDPEVWGIWRRELDAAGNPHDTIRILVDRDASRTYALENTTLVVTSTSGTRTTYVVGATVAAGDGGTQLTFNVRPVGRDTLAEASLAFTMAGPRTTVMTTPVTVAWSSP